MKKLFVSITTGALFLAVFLPLFSHAFSLRSAPEITIPEDEVIDENLYLLGGKIYFDKTFNEDLVTVSGDSNISGVVFGDLHVFSGKTVLNGEVFCDSRIVAGEVYVDGNTNKDLVIIAGKVIVSEKAILNGETMIVAGEVEFMGQALDDVKIIAGKTIINGEISGNLEITSQEIYIKDGSEIQGDFVYFSPKKAEINTSAIVQNEPIYNQIESLKENALIKKTVLSFISFWTIIKFLSTLFVAFILVFVFRMFSQRTAVIATEHVLKSLATGIISLLLIPLLFLILFASLFALPISIIILLLYIVALLLVPAVSGIIVGYWIQIFINKNNKSKAEVDFNSATLGVIILTFLYFIPFVGSFLRLALLFLSFGAMIIYYFDNLVIRKKK